ncbi:MAG: hypothetical protein WCI18_04015 [Pseudomonadota bacterium]
MLAKVFEIDVTRCQHGKGEMSIVAAIISYFSPKYFSPKYFTALYRTANQLLP